MKKRYVLLLCAVLIGFFLLACNDFDIDRDANSLTVKSEQQEDRETKQQVEENRPEENNQVIESP